MIDRDEPFVLLDDARAGGGPARLYRELAGTITATTSDTVRAKLDAVRVAVADGWHVAGFIGYEAGLMLEPRLAPIAPPPVADDPPLLWFGLFRSLDLIDPSAVAALLPDPRGARALPPRPRISRAAYDAAFARVADYIAAGDIYQANLSFRADVAVAGHPLALYAHLRAASAAGWGGITFTGDHWLLSASPELFFTLTGDVLEARPMKGTARRGPTRDADAAAAATLAADPKERAENLMIVDLLRNDLSRIAVAGSVAVPALFSVETYPTLHTLTSTVTARLSPVRDAIDALAAIFPCGSVTGAPKIRAMEIIGELEDDARGPYTGSLGWLSPDGDAAFNVMIRTVVLDHASATRGHGTGTLGLGSAIVADSRAADEWAECMTKGRFVAGGGDGLRLLETMRFEPGIGIVAQARHLARMRASATILGHRFGRHVNERLAAAVRLLDQPTRVRLSLDRTGETAIDLSPLPMPAPVPATVALCPLPVDAADFRLRHKTSDRAFYDDARIASDAFEVAFIDRDGFVTEGSFTTIFVDRDGALLTPPLSRGLLPGILRQTLIDEGAAREADITADDLVDGFLIGNSLRGLLPARLKDD